MEGTILFWILAGYFALLGLWETGKLLADTLLKPRRREASLFLIPSEDPDRTEAALSYYCRKFRDDTAAGGHLFVIPPQNPEAGEICRRFCRDRGLPLADCSRSAKVL